MVKYIVRLFTTRKPKEITLEEAGITMEEVLNKAMEAAAQTIRAQDQRIADLESQIKHLTLERDGLQEVLDEWKNIVQGETPTINWVK